MTADVSGVLSKRADRGAAQGFRCAALLTVVVALMSGCVPPPSASRAPMASENRAASPRKQRAVAQPEILPDPISDQPEPLLGRATERGKATWYGGSLHGSKTASGERFDQWALTAAHRTLPLGRWVRVTNLKNGRVVTVRINDRGPWGKDRTRIIDVSRRAADQLDMVSDGVVPVEIEVVRDASGLPRQ